MTAIVLSLAIFAAIAVTTHGKGRNPGHLDVFLNPADPGGQDQAATIARLLSAIPAVSSFRIRPAPSHGQTLAPVIDGGVSLLPCFQPGCLSGPSVPDLPAVFEVFLTSKSGFGSVATQLVHQPLVLAAVPVPAGHNA